MLNRHVSFTVDSNVPTQLAEAQVIQMFCLNRETNICKVSPFLEPFLYFTYFSMSESEFRG